MVGEAPRQLIMERRDVGGGVSVKGPFLFCLPEVDKLLLLAGWSSPDDKRHLHLWLG